MVSWHGFKRRLANHQLQHTLKAVAKTPPIQAQPDSDVILVSQLHPRDLYGYLVAIKSVLYSFDRAAVLVVCDGLTSGHKKTLADHIPQIQFQDIADVHYTGLQKEGTWERLVTLIRESQHRYAMQVDSDILALDRLDTVLDYIHSGVSFALTDRKTTGYQSLTAASQWIADHEKDSPHIQYLIESNLHHFPRADERQYIKATSAFTGFAKGSANLDQLIEFSEDAEKIAGGRWQEWGSEQISSNYLVANTPTHALLPRPAYVNHTPHESLDGAKLIHFFGTHRHYQGRYRRMAAQIINKLQEKTG